MNHIDGFWDTNKELYYQAWIPNEWSHILVISHGLGEHSGRYEDFAKFLCEHKMAVYACDHYGHGQSVGNRGHIDEFGKYARDLKSFIEFVTKESKSTKIHLLGHSLGGIIVHDLIWQWTENIDKIIISNPGYKKKIPPTKIKVILGNLVGKLFPKLSFNNELDVTGLSTDKEVIKKYCDDPLVHDRVTALWFLTFTEKVNELSRKTLKNVINPILFISSLSDPLTDQNYTTELFEKLECPNCSMIHFEGMLHELLNEVDKDKVYNNVLLFLS